MLTDPIADMIARIKNAALARMENVDIPASKMKLSIADILLKEGYIKAYKVIEDAKQGVLRINLKYMNQTHVITTIERVSKPGRRIYRGSDELPRVRDGLGISIVSTSQGLMTNTKAKELGIGGEVILNVW